jgi:hypothetical protein
MIFRRSILAKTRSGKKIVQVKGYKRKPPGGERKVRTVRTHRKSTRTKKIVQVKGYKRKLPGGKRKVIPVRAHRKSILSK